MYNFKKMIVFGIMLLAAVSICRHDCYAAEEISVRDIVVYSDEDTKYINVTVNFRNDYSQPAGNFFIKCSFQNQLASSDKMNLGSNTRRINKIIKPGEEFSVTFFSMLKTQQEFKFTGNDNSIEIDTYWSRNDEGKRLSESPGSLRFPLHLEFEFYK